jgi:hypothetical protein
MKKLAIVLALMLSIEVHAAPAEYTYSCWPYGDRNEPEDR